MIAELDIESTAWYNVGLEIGLKRFRKGLSSLDDSGEGYLNALEEELKKFNGWLVRGNDTTLNRVFFETENDMLLFQLRWV